MAARTAYLGPAGSWTHQACLDLYGADGLVPLSREALFAAYADGKVERACVPVATSVVGLTPYMEDVLALPRVVVVAEYPKMLGYSLLARPGTRREDIKEVHAHPVAFEEVRPWLEAGPRPRPWPPVPRRTRHRSAPGSGHPSISWSRWPMASKRGPTT